MACHETKYCPRCTAPFECKVGNILFCQCDGIIFSESEKAFIGDRYQDCLCRQCLIEMKKEVKHSFLKDKLQKIISLFKTR